MEVYIVQGEDVVFSNDQGDIWEVGKGLYKVYVKNPALNKKIVS
jgi:hypothetical protein